MNNSTYLFGLIGGRFYQMPHDYLNSVLSNLPKKKSFKQSQIVVHRDSNLMYYCYIRQLSAKDYLGICVLVNDIYMTDIAAMFVQFEKCITSLVVDGEILKFSEKGDVEFACNTFIEKSDYVNQFLGELHTSFSLLGKEKKLPVLNYAVSKDDCKVFEYSDKQEDILTASYTYGYTFVYKDKNYSTVSLNSYKGVITQKEKKIIELKAEINKLTDSKKELAKQVNSLKNKQRNMKWVGVFALVAFVLGVIVWNKVLFPSIVTNYDAGEYMYYGPMENGKPNGIGIAIYPKNDKMKRLYYYGNFTDGQRVDSAAIMFYKDGSYFRGSMNNDKWFKGIFFDVEKEHFIGEFNNGEPWNGTWYKHVPVQKIIDGE